MVYPYKHPWKATLLGVLLAIGILLACLALAKTHGLELATNYTGRASALLFLPVFIARPLVGLFGPARFGKLVRQRPGFGLVLAGNHHVHMILLTVFLVGEGEGPATFFLNPGLYIYFLLALMNVTSFPWARKTLSKTTINRIHFFGLYALAAAFFQTLVLSVFTGDESGVFRVTYTGLFLLALAIRVAAFFKAKRAKKSGALT